MISLGSLVKYTLRLDSVSRETRNSLCDTFDPVSWTGVSRNLDSSVIRFFLMDNERLEDFAKIPPECRVEIEGTLRDRT